MQKTSVSVLTTYKLILSSYRDTWFSLVMVLFSLLIACAGLSAVLLINQGAKHSYSGDTYEQLLPASYQIVAAEKDQSISKADYVLIKNLGLSNALAIAESSKHLFTDTQQLTGRRITVLGLDFLSMMNQSIVTNENAQEVSAKVAISTSEIKGSANDNQASALQYASILSNISFGRTTALIHPKFMQELGISVEQPLYFEAARKRPLPTLSPIDIGYLSDAIVMDIGELFAIDASTSISRVLLLDRETRNAASAGSMRMGEQNAENYDWLNASLPGHLKLQKIELGQSDPQMTESFYLNLMAMALLMFAVCLFIVMNACNLLIFKRFAMLKVFRQLGIGRRQIITAHGFEFVLFSMLISALGLFVGSQLAMLAAPTIRNIVEGLYRVEVGFADSEWLILYLKILAICLAGVALALLAPIRQLNQSLSNTQAVADKPALNIYLMAGCVTLAATAVLIFSLSLNLSFMLVAAACIILSGCCALIVMFKKLLNTAMWLIPKRFTLLRLSVAQAIFLSSKTKIACCAFFIAATSNLGMNLMVDSFRSSTESWLVQRLAADHYLYSQNAVHNQQLTALATEHRLVLYPRYDVNIEYNNQYTQLFSYPLEDSFTQAMVFESAQENVWRLFEQGDAVFVNQQFSIRNRLGLGDIVDFSHPGSGRLKGFEIAGIIYDYGNPFSQILLPLSEFTQDIAQASIFAVVGDAENIEAFVQSLEQIGIDTNTQFYETTALLKQSMQVFDRTFVITDSLNFVTLLVAALSLACTIIILMEQSRPQTMLLRTLGLSAWQSRGLLLMQYMFLCMVALLAATPFGILLSYVLIEQINYHAFNWSYPLIVDWSSIIKLYLLSLLIVVGIISLPIIHASKQSLAQELKWLD